MFEGASRTFLAGYVNDRELKQEVRIALTDIQNNLPRLYQETKQHFRDEENIISSLKQQISEFLATCAQTDTQQIRYFLKHILLAIEGLCHRLIEPCAVTSPLTAFKAFIAKLEPVLKTLEPASVSNHSTLESLEREKALSEEQKELNSDSNFHVHLTLTKELALKKMLPTKRIFISHAWPIEDQHAELWTKAFVKMFAQHLIEAGLLVELDDIQSGFGLSLHGFMREKIQKSDHIFVICNRTMEYKFATDGATGVMFEYLEIMRRWKSLRMSQGEIEQRFIVPICLNKESYIPGLFAKFAEVSFYNHGYLAGLRFILEKTYGFEAEYLSHSTDAAYRASPLLVVANSSSAALAASSEPQGTHFTVLPAEKKTTELIFPTESLVNIPEVVPHLQSREQLLAQLEERMIHHLVVLCGIAGVGKTQLATSYAHRFREKYSNGIAYKIAVDSDETFTYGIQELVTKMRVCLGNRQENASQDNAQFLHQFFKGNHPPCLLFIDNVDDLAAKIAVKDFLSKLPNSQNLWIIITTQDAYFHSNDKYLLPINGFVKEEYWPLLKGKLGRRINEAQAETLALRFDYLPLAMAAATLYLEKNPAQTVTEYLEMLEDPEVKRSIGHQENRLLRDHYTSKPPQFRNQRAAILYSLNSCYLQWNEENKFNPQDLEAVKKLANYFSFLEVSSIPRVILVNIIMQMYACNETMAQFRINNLLNALQEYSLLQQHPGSTISMHHITQEAIDMTLSVLDKRVYLLVLIQILTELTSHCLSDYKHTSLEHLIAINKQLAQVYRYAKQVDLTDAFMLATASCRLGEAYNIITGDLIACLVYFAESEKYLMTLPQSPARDTILTVALQGQARVYTHKENGAEKAVELYQRALSYVKDPSLERAEIYRRLGIAYRKLKRYTEAIEHHYLGIQNKKQLPQCPPESLYDSYRSLGSACCNYVNRLAGYERDKMLEQSLEAYQQALWGFMKLYDNPFHKNIAHTIDNLGGVFGSKQDYAKELACRTIGFLLNSAILGIDHQNICWSLSALGACYIRSKDTLRAIAYMEKAKETAEKREGPDGETTRETNDYLKKLLAEIDASSAELVRYYNNHIIERRKYVFYIEKLSAENYRIKLLNCGNDMSASLCQQLEHRALNGFRNASIDALAASCFQLLPGEQKFLVLAGCNFLDDRETAFLNLTPRYRISCAQEVYLEEHLQQLTIKTAFNLLAESSEKILLCLAKHMEEKWLQALLSGEIVENFLKNPHLAPSYIQVLCRNYADKQDELDKKKELNAGPRFFELGGNGEIIRLHKEIAEVKRALLTACQNFTVCQYYLNQIKEERLIPGYTFLLAYAQCSQQVNVLVYCKNSTNTDSLLLDERRFFRHEKRSITLLRTPVSVLDYVELNIPFSHQMDQRYQMGWVSYLQSLSFTSVNALAQLHSI